AGHPCRHGRLGHPATPAGRGPSRTSEGGEDGPPLGRSGRLTGRACHSGSEPDQPMTAPPSAPPISPSWARPWRLVRPQHLWFVAVGTYNTAFGYGTFAGVHLAAPHLHYMFVLLIAHVISTLNAFVAYRLLVFRV